jgi:hypothetical protein
MSDESSGSDEEPSSKLIPISKVSRSPLSGPNSRGEVLSGSPGERHGGRGEELSGSPGEGRGQGLVIHGGGSSSSTSSALSPSEDGRLQGKGRAISTSFGKGSSGKGLDGNRLGKGSSGRNQTLGDANDLKKRKLDSILSELPTITQVAMKAATGALESSGNKQAVVAFVNASADISAPVARAMGPSLLEFQGGRRNAEDLGPVMYTMLGQTTSMLVGSKKF